MATTGVTKAARHQGHFLLCGACWRGQGSTGEGMRAHEFRDSLVGRAGLEPALGEPRSGFLVRCVCHFPTAPKLRRPHHITHAGSDPATPPPPPTPPPLL